MSNQASRSSVRSARRFATTRWSVVAAAGRESSADSREALESLCQAYWLPLYAYVLRRVGNVDEARDLTQAFFARLLEKNYLTQADSKRGRFRSFLITAFKHFLSKEWEKARAQKRGGGQRVLSIDFQAGDSSISFEPASTLTPEQVYERQWAVTLLQRVIDRLRTEYDSAGKLEQFEHLRHFIIGQYSDTTYADVATTLESTEAAMKMTAHRMRRRYRELLRDEIADTAVAADDVDDEIRSLFELFQD